MEAETIGNFLASLTQCKFLLSLQHQDFICPPQVTCGQCKGSQLKLSSGEMSNIVVYVWKIKGVDGHNLMNSPYFSSIKFFPSCMFYLSTIKVLGMQYGLNIGRYTKIE